MAQNNPFYYIPNDVLQTVLGPYLDIESMINFNRVVDHNDKVYRRFPEEYAIKHQLLVSSAKYTSMLNRFESTSNYNTKCKILYGLFKDTIQPINRVFLWHHKVFRKKYINKMYQFQNPLGDVYDEKTSKSWRKSFVSLATRTIVYFKANPFKYALKGN